MKSFRILLTSLFFVISASAFGQIGQMDDEAYYDSIVNAARTVKNLNIVYKPVVGVGFGVMNFYGEVHDRVRLPIMGAPAFKLNVATFLDAKHLFKTNFVILTGAITGNEHSATDTTRNLNFRSDIFSIGLNIHYDFSPFIKPSARLRPFVSVGIENLQFNSKTDMMAGNQKYFYWNDGTTRDQPQSYGTGNLISRDYTYETDLRDLNRNGLGSYSQNTFAIPIDVGLDLKISDRINLRLANSWHYTFTDYIDDVTPKGTFRKGDKFNDWFTYSYFSLHFDMFSTSAESKLKNFVVDVTANDVMDFDDEDNDGVFDFIDHCPGTPSGVPVDSVGCPLDRDHDGVFDPFDKEPNTLPGAIVNENGVQISAEDYASSLKLNGITRKEVEAFLMMRRAQNRMKGRSSVPIPPKFKSIDTDGDSYISFDELVRSINDFFDSSSNLSTKDIYELQDFFFEQ